MNNYYVYVYYDPLNNEPFYVGKGTGNRKNKHLYEKKESTENIRKYYRIQKIKKAGLLPIIKVVCDKLTEEESYKIESQLIRYYGRLWYDKGGILTNVCLDARPPGMKGKSHTEQTKDKIRKKMKKWVNENGNPMQGKKHSEKSKKLMSLQKKILGSTITEKGRIQISQSSSARNIGKGNPMYGRKRKAMYNPQTMECRYIDITSNTIELENLKSIGWKFGLIRKTKD